MMPVIVSHVPGRMRVRLADLRSPDRNAAVAAALAGWDGVTAAQGKPACGSIVLHYDPARIAPDQMQTRVDALLGGGEAAGRPAPPACDQGLSLWSLNRPAKIGMLGALAGTLGALAVGKTLHAAFGAAHLVFLAVHLANHRKKILQ